MPITTKEIVIEERLLGAVLALAPKDQAKLVQLLSEQLPPGEQVRLIMHLLPNVAPTIKAALRSKTLPIIGGGSAEDAQSLLESWLNEPAADEDGESWDEIMHNLGAANKFAATHADKTHLRGLSHEATQVGFAWVAANLFAAKFPTPLTPTPPPTPRPDAPGAVR